jgi:16S rRNA (cytosine967-C5)-methyltransferase
VTPLSAGLQKTFMGISQARKIAYEVLRRVESEGAYASDLLHEMLGPGVRPEDAGLATEISLGVLRRRRLLDFLLHRHLKKAPSRLDLPVLLALRMGLYQLWYLEKVPAHAAVHESVELVKRARKSSAAPLVNAVLRRAVEDKDIAVKTLLPADASSADRLGILHSHPTWMIERWLERFGEARTIALLEANNRAPRPSCAPQDVPARHEMIAALSKAGLEIENGTLLREAFSVRGGSPARTALFRRGKFSIQDEASQIIPLLLGVRPGDRVLDLCAAPGGKTAPLARATGKSGVVVAADRYAHRLRAMREQFRRIRLPHINIVELDATRQLPFDAQFDKILVDAPCTGTGTLARHPEIRWRLAPENLVELHALQVSILVAAAERLAPDGCLVYSTCSLEKEENEDVVNEALGRLPSLRRAPREEVIGELQPHLIPGVAAESLIDTDAQFHTMPGEQLCDGFFAAVLKRSAAT